MKVQHQAKYLGHAQSLFEYAIALEEDEVTTSCLMMKISRQMSKLVKLLSSLHFSGHNWHFQCRAMGAVVHTTNFQSQLIFFLHLFKHQTNIFVRCFGKL